MNDAQSTLVGLKSQDCPGGGWNGMPPELQRATVADCLAHGVCGCIYGDAVKHIERLRTALGASICAMEIASALPAVAAEYDFSDALKQAWEAYGHDGLRHEQSRDEHRLELERASNRAWHEGKD